jgi:Undecaprenyl-phosphate galactose phosphotransferase WbaP
MLLASDIAAIVWACMVMQLIVERQGLVGGLNYSHILLIVGCLCSWFASQGHYLDRRECAKEILQISFVVGLCTLLTFSQFGSSLVFWTTTALSLVAGRATCKWLMFQIGYTNLPTVIIGPAASCNALRTAMEGDWYRGISVQHEISCDEIRYEQIAPVLKDLAASEPAGQIILVGDLYGREVRRLKGLASRLGLTLSVGHPDEGHGDRFIIDRFFGIDLLVTRWTPTWSPMPVAGVKRAFDFIVAGAVLVLTAPLFLIVAWLVGRDGGPVLYASPRIGRGGTSFKALKFRTMVLDADQALQDLLARDPAARREWKTTFKLRNDPRITPVGHFLRRFSLDELPQLINVIRGQMSLVGPRPMLPIEREAYGEAFELYRRSVPGITGPWQISGRSNLPYHRRAELNAWYAKNTSIWVDIYILLRTVSVVFRQAGAI